MNSDDILARLANTMGKDDCISLALDILESEFSINTLINLTENQKRQIELRAAWVLTTIVEQYPEALIPHTNTILDHLISSENDSVIRCFLKIISVLPLIEDRLSEILEYVTDVMMNRAKPVALHVYAMTIFYQITEIEPDLKYELREIISHLMEEGSPAIISRGRHLLTKLNKEMLMN